MAGTTEQMRMAATNATARQGAVGVPLNELAAPPRYPAVRAVERKLKISVLSGGTNTEREVSLRSGRAVAEALRSLGHAVTTADVGPDNLEALDLPVDMVFIALHGSFGEDGCLQKLLEARGTRYCGSPPEASALAMDKVAAKKRFVEAGVPTPRFDVVSPGRVEQVLRFWSPPAAVKPVAAGSSVDCVMAFDGPALAAALGELSGRYERCLIEQYIRGPELTVGVLGDEALPPIQIRTRRPFYDYQAKYLDEDTEYLFDIDLPAEVLEKVKELSLRAHRALGCRDFSRVDWMIDGQTHQPYVLEVNTIPGFTDHSLLPKAARRAGLGFAELCQRIVALTCEALMEDRMGVIRKRHKQRSQEPQECRAAGASSLGPLVPLLCTAGLIAGAVWGLEKIKANVYASPAYRPAAIKIVLANPPDWVVREKWQARILSTIAVPSPDSWMDEGLTRRLADAVAASGWVRSVQRVSKHMDGTIEIAADYRRPIVMVMTDHGYVPVDREGYRLPEVYDRVEANSGWIRVRGVTEPPPRVNAAFDEKAAPDAMAALRLAALIFDQSWEIASRISAIDVTNFRGRQDRRDCHIKLWTPDGTLIKWGSAIGEEMEENSPAEKLAQIAVMLKRGGPQAQVDISTLPNRAIITVPPAIETADISNHRPR